MLSLQWVLFVHPPGFWDGSSPWFSVATWKKSRCCVIWTPGMRYFELELQQIMTCVPEGCWNSFFLKETDDWFYCPLKQSSVLMLPTKCAQTRELWCRSPRNFSTKSIFLVVRSTRFSIRTRQARKFSSLIGWIGPDYLHSGGRNQRFWSLNPLLRRAAFQEWVVSILVRKQHSALCLLKQRFPWILRWCWSGLLLVEKVEFFNHPGKITSRVIY